MRVRLLFVFVLQICFVAFCGLRKSNWIVNDANVSHETLQTDTLNPFDVNGQIFNGGGVDNVDKTPSDKDKKDDENNVVLTNEQLLLLEDQRQELADLRRQVVFLQVSPSVGKAFRLPAHAFCCCGCCCCSN